MPEISRFLGIAIGMFYSEHGVPHFHAGMNYHVVEARYVGGHVVWLRFRDDTQGEVDLSSALRGPVFEPLRDPTVFAQFRIHPEFHTLVWPNGVDFAPEFLHDRGKVTT